MKRMVAILIAGAAFSAASYAQTNTVSSANIVGYVQTQTPSSNSFDIISLVQFSDGSDSVNIQSAIANLSNLTASTTWSNADKLIIWNGGYVTFGLYKPSSGNPYWMASGAGWSIPAFAKQATNQLERGKGVWFQAGANSHGTNMIVSGDVFLDNTFDVNLVGTLTLLAYPYSSDINLTNMVISNATAAATWVNADKLVIWNGGYVSYGLYQPTSGNPYWMASGAGWSIPAFAKPTTNVTINLGKGFWYQSVSGAKTIRFNKIYSVN
ncbi:MAG: hypothetical protein WC334_06725 [Kiritimatiellales bacterium]